MKASKTLIALVIIVLLNVIYFTGAYRYLQKDVSLTVVEHAIKDAPESLNTIPPNPNKNP